MKGYEELENSIAGLASARERNCAVKEKTGLGMGDHISRSPYFLRWL